MAATTPGQIITFYSYKGGTGRTMALANIACLLAEQQTNGGEKGVLMIDWDLEAPGLHNYFRKHLQRPKTAKTKKKFQKADSYAKNGLIEFFYEVSQRIDEKLKANAKASSPSRSSDFSPTSETIAQQALEEMDLNSFVSNLDINGLFLMQAGNFDSNQPKAYGELVNTFDWEALYNKSPHIFRVFAEFLAQRFSYVLVDSRTGVTDVSGICTNLLPEKLVIVFTPNMQSLEGGLELIKRATAYRQESADLRSLMVYPLVSRVASEEPKLRSTWRFGNAEGDIPGFQRAFEKVLSMVYSREKISLSKYFDEVQIQHLPRYAYGEEIAVLVEKIEDRFSLKRSYETFLHKLTKTTVPWEYKKDELQEKHCYVIMGLGKKTDVRTGKEKDFDKLYFSVVKPAVEEAGLACLRADEIAHSNLIDVPMYNELLKADLVIADLSIANPSTFYELGIRHTLRPFGTILMTDDSALLPFDLTHFPIHVYNYNKLEDFDEMIRLRTVLSNAILQFGQQEHVSPDSPVYTFLNDLVPPSITSVASTIARNIT
jgi:MinD-like ATPase involved in chromosome partitioning or flagellar assembly